MRGEKEQFRAFRLSSNYLLGHTPEIKMKSGEVVMLRPWDRIGGIYHNNRKVEILGLNGEPCEFNQFCSEYDLEDLGDSFDELYTSFDFPTPKEDTLYWYTGTKLIVVKKESMTPFPLVRGDIVEAKLKDDNKVASVYRINDEAVLGCLEIDMRFLEKFDLKHPYISG